MKYIRIHQVEAEPMTPDELTAVCNSFRIAYAAWRAE